MGIQLLLLNLDNASQIVFSPPLFMARIDFPTKLLLFARANRSCITFRCWTYLWSVSFWIKDSFPSISVLHFLLRNNAFFFFRNLTDCHDYNLFRCRYKHSELVINYDTWNIHWSRSWKNYISRTVVYNESLTRKPYLCCELCWPENNWFLGAMDCH